MKKVLVTCSVKKNSSGGVSLETFETQVDSSVIGKASGMSSKHELDSWAKTFFPTAVEVKFSSIKVIS